MKWEKVKYEWLWGIDNDMNMLIDSYEGNVYEGSARLMKKMRNAGTALAKTNANRPSIHPSVYSSRLHTIFTLLLQHMLFNSSTL